MLLLGLYWSVHAACINIIRAYPKELLRYAQNNKYRNIQLNRNLLITGKGFRPVTNVCLWMNNMGINIYVLVMWVRYWMHSHGCMSSGPWLRGEWPWVLTITAGFNFWGWGMKGFCRSASKVYLRSRWFQYDSLINHGCDK